jgi:serine/threonine protein kinase
MAPRLISGTDPNYAFISVLGRGGFGTVSKVRRHSDGAIVACKAIDCSSNRTVLRLAAREVDTWASIGQEKYVAEFSRDYAWNEATATMRLYMTYYEGGDLQSVIDSCRFKATTLHPLVATFWALEIAKGVKACHEREIIHRDLKPPNSKSTYQRKI